jgi:F-type H+-transporting ATPase subunit b
MATRTDAFTEASPSGEHGGGFPPFQAETFASQLLWLAICFAALYLIVSKLALPRVGSIIAERRGKIAADLDEASRLKNAADEALAAYEKSVAEARGRAQAIAAERREKINAEAEKNRKGIEAQVQQRIAEAEKALLASKQAAMANVRAIAAEAAGAIVDRLIGVTPPEKAVSAAVEEVLQG